MKVINMRHLLTLFFIGLISASVVSQKLCPPNCQCSKSIIRCLHQALEAIPETPNDVHVLDLRFNKISNIEPGFLSRMDKLRSLLLNDNAVQSLRSGAFRGLRRLKYLYLYRNRIQHIDPDVFQDMKNLEQLYLQVNEIHQISPDTFSNMPQLERLYLHNNLLRRIPRGSFQGMPRLQKLRLDSNALTCDCSIAWLVRMVFEHSDMSVDATCREPVRSVDVAIASLKEEDLHCQQPTIEREPQDVVIDFGADAVFTCAVAGDPAPDITWFRDSAKISLDGTRYEIMNDGSLMVHNVDESDIGVFECMANSSAGEARSRKAKMIIQNKTNDNDSLKFVVTPQSQEVKINHDILTFDCVATGNPLPHIEWYHNDAKILLSERVKIKSNGTIVIRNVIEDDAGSFVCQAHNIVGKIKTTAVLKVKFPPKFTKKPENNTVIEGDEVRLHCAVKGFPEPIIKWYKNSAPIIQNENLLLEERNQTLVIFAVSSFDEGLYNCICENSEGIVEASAQLTIYEKTITNPHILLKPEDTEAFKGTSIQMPCEVDSDIPVSIEWRKDGSRIISNERLLISSIGSLIINNLTIQDTGRYECSVFNEYGRDTASVFLLVKDNLLPGDEYVNIALTEATKEIDDAINKTIENIFKNTNTHVNINDLFRITRFPNAPAREIARAAEIYERTLEKVRYYIQRNENVSSAEPFQYEDILSPQHLEVIARLSGCTAHRKNQNCSDICYHKKYRSIDGSCNNLNNPMWGSSLTGFRRILLPVYENGFSQPVGWNKNLKYNGFPLPGSRLISTSIITTETVSEDDRVSHMAMQWGQWLDHDLDHALPSVSSQTWDGVDCKKTCEYAAPCYPIDVPEDDPRIKNRRCIDFIKTSSVCGSGMTSVLFGKLQPREQINQLTSFLDASQVYGFEKSVSEDLRDLTNDNGLLRVGATFPEKKPLLPTIGTNGMDCRRNLEESSKNCFVAGDIRANEQVGLAAMHTIWMREHNRIALVLKSLNPHWNGDTVYQESRKIVGAEMQFITYEHWLPLILGKRGYEKLGTYKEYNPNINPSISNVFATAALRFGHSMINPILHRYDENFEVIPQGHLLLRNAFFSPWRLVDEGGVDPLLRGMFTTPAKLKTPTQNLNSELTEQLFYSAHAVALDLAAINIQRGREHALPSYSKWRIFCNMSEVNDFEDLAREISNSTVRDKLKTLYKSVHNIDVWVGGILEDQVDGGKVGPLFQCLLIEQLKRLRDGDRFWYENLDVFKLEQIRQIKRSSLARVLCDNGDNIDTIGENVFLIPEVQGGLTSCDDIPSMDLRYWADCESCEETDAVSRIPRSISDDASNDARLSSLEDSQYDLEKTVNKLKKKIEQLEDKFAQLKLP